MKKLLLSLSLLGGVFAASAQIAFSENFDGATFPPTGWSVVTTNADATWVQALEADGALTGAGSAFVNWSADGGTTAAGPQDEALISPSFSLVGYTSAFLQFNFLTSYTYMVLNPNGDFTVEVSTNGGTSWTQIFLEDDYLTSTADNYVVIPVELNLAAYVGQANVKLRFKYVAEDADVLFLDDIVVTSCASVQELTLTSLTDTSFGLGWVTSAAGVDVELGPEGFTQGTGTLTSNITTGTYTSPTLTQSTGYSFYIKASCGTVWDGPYTIYTPMSATNYATPDYGFSFEDPTLAYAGWSALRVTANTGATWGIIEGADVANNPLAQNGDVYARAGAFGTASNAYLFSRGLNLTAGTPYAISYYRREVIGAGNGGANALALKVGTDKTDAAMTTTLAATSQVNETTWTLKTANFTPATTGVYYFGLQYTCTAQAQANFGWAAVDNFFVDNTLSTADDLIGAFAVLPNPASDVISIMNSKNIPVNAITVTDLNGRVVKRNQYSDVFTVDMNVSDLATGTYIMNIETDRGAVTKKIVKK